MVRETNGDRFAPTRAFLQGIVFGRKLAEQGELQGAERVFLNALASVRGRRDGDEVLALRSLITVYGRTGRYFESLILGRQLADLTRVPGAEEHLVHAYGGICGALNRLYMVELLGTELDEMKALLRRVSGSARHVLEKAYHESGAAHAIHVRDVDRARDHLAGFRRAMATDVEPTEEDRFVAMTCEAEIALLEGDAPRAIGTIEQIGRTDLPPERRLQIIPRWIRAALATGDTRCAAERAREGMALLEAIAREPFRCSDRIEQGAQIARFLAGELEMRDAAQEAYDLVAGAVLTRIAQLDQAVHNLPALGSADAAYTDELISHRKRFVAEQHALMVRVAKFMRERGHALDRDRLGKGMPDGFVAVCAWCGRVCPEPDTWIPVGQFVPRNTGPRITHTMCPTCAERVV